LQICLSESHPIVDGYQEPIGSGCAPISACSGYPANAGFATPFLSRDLRYPRYGRVLGSPDGGTHTVDDITARLADLETASSEVSPSPDIRFQGGGLLDTEIASS